MGGGGGGQTTSGAKRLVGAKRPGGKRPGGNVLGVKRLGEEMVWGRNVPDSFRGRKIFVWKEALNKIFSKISL